MIYRHNKTFSALSDTMFFVSEDPVTVGIDPVNAEIPDRFSLFQNYPNPFNPMTKLKFQMPDKGFVKLTVFDVLGKEIETLVNEELHAGIYEYEWNALTLPSGIYLYKLTADKFTETKKMVLIK
jgi:hypothetical protein